MDVSSLLFDFLEGEVDMEFKDRIEFIDEKLSSCVNVGGSFDQGIKFFTGDGVVVFLENELQGKSFFDVNADLDQPE